MATLLSRFFSLVLIALLTACGGGGGGFTGTGDENTSTVAEISLPAQVSTNGRLAVVSEGESLPLRLVVKDKDGKPTPGVGLTYTTTIGTLSTTALTGNKNPAAAQLRNILSQTRVGLDNQSGGKSITISTDVSGVATAYLTGDGTSGTAEITATAGKVSQSFKVNLSQVGEISVSTANESIRSDGIDKTRVWATVKDANKEAPIAGAKVSFTTIAGTLSPVSLETSLDNIKTDIDGVAEIFLTAPKYAGSTTITATSGGFTGSVNVNFVANALNTKLNLNAAPTTINPKGSTTLRATVSDANNYPVAGQTVNFDIFANRTEGNLSAPSATTDTNGQATVTYTAGSNEGTDILRARLADGKEMIVNVVINANATVVGSVTMTMGASSIVADGISMVNARATVKDTDGNAAVGMLVSFATTAGKVSATAAITNNMGIAEIMLIAPKLMGSAIVTSNASGFSATATVNFVAGAAIKIDLNLAPTKLNPKGLSTLQATAMDTNNNPVSGQTVSFDIPSNKTGGTLSAAAAITDNNGQAKVTYTAGNIEGTDTLRARLPNGSEDRKTVVVNAAATVVGSVTMDAGAPSAVADGSSVVAILATVKDTGGNAAVAATVIFSTTAGTLKDKNGKITTTAVTGANGVAELWLIAPKGIGSVTITGNVSGFIASVTVNFTAGAPTQVMLIATPSTINPNGVSTVQATALDVNNNPVVNQTVIFDITNSPPKGNLNATSAITDNNGRATVTYTAGSTEGIDTLRARLANGIQQTVAVAINTSARVVGSIVVTMGATSVVADGTSKVAARAIVRDTDGNAVANKNVTFTTTAGILSQTQKTTNINGLSEVMLTAPIHVGNATVTGSVDGFNASATVSFVAGAPEKVILKSTSLTLNPKGSASIDATVLDVNDNAVSGQTVSFNISTNGSSGSGGSLSAAVAITDNNGRATVTYTAGNVAGTDTILARLTNGKEDTLSIKVVPTGNATKLSLSTTQTAIKSDNSDSATITAIALDGNNVVVSGVTITFQTDTGQLSAGSVITDNNGKASVIFSSGTIDPSNAIVTINAYLGTVDATALPPPDASIPIVIIGSTITLAADLSNLEVNSSTILTATLKNAAGIAIPQQKVTFSWDSDAAELTDIVGYDGDKSDVNGQVKKLLTAKSPGKITITANGLGAQATRDFVISATGSAFQITQPSEDPSTLSIDAPLTVKVNAVNTANVTFVTSLGKWLESNSNLYSVDSINSTAQATLISTQSGTATIRAFDTNNSSTKFDSKTILISASVTQAHHVVLQSNLTTMPPSVGTTYPAELTATVYTIANEPVKDARVVFSLSNTTGSGEKINPIYGLTDSSGQVKSTFTSGSLSSGQEGVKITATLYDTSSTIISSDFINIKITKTAGSVVIGTSTVMSDENGSTSYKMPMTVMVADSVGAAVPNAVISLSAWPVQYAKGAWYSPTGDGKDCVPIITGVFENEDVNENVILDSGEDTNGDNMLTPPNSAAGTIPATVTTDSNGVFTFNLIYLKKYAMWVVNRIRATTLVLGTEMTGEILMYQRHDPLVNDSFDDYRGLPVTAADAKGCFVFDSPFN
ncbi:exported hypothetical protein [Gammaproteobacteria bacterium]